MPWRLCHLRHVRCPAPIAVAGGSDDLDLVWSGAGDDAVVPARSLLGVVARCAVALAVVDVSRPAGAVCDDVIDVPDGRLAPRRAADAVAQADEAPLRRSERASGGLHRDQGA